MSSCDHSEKDVDMIEKNEVKSKKTVKFCQNKVFNESSDPLRMSSTSQEVFSEDFHVRKQPRITPWDSELSSINCNYEEISNHHQNCTCSCHKTCNSTQFPKKQKFRIFLIRHGLSEANIDQKKYVEMADSSIALSDIGLEQASECGEQLNKYFEKLYKHKRPANRRSRLWVSPYLRARQTAQQIYNKAHYYIDDVREHILLGEQQFGIFEGVDWTTLADDYPEEIKFMEKMSLYKARFWARPPLGESRFDVCQRVHQSFGSFHRDAESHGIYDLIIVSHGVTIRAFLMMWLHLHPEWFEAEPNPENCSIRLIDDCNDRGYIWNPHPFHPDHTTISHHNLNHNKNVDQDRVDDRDDQDAIDVINPNDNSTTTTSTSTTSPPISPISKKSNSGLNSKTVVINTYNEPLVRSKSGPIIL